MSMTGYPRSMAPRPPASRIPKMLLIVIAAVWLIVGIWIYDIVPIMVVLWILVAVGLIVLWRVIVPSRQQAAAQAKLDQAAQDAALQQWRARQRSLESALSSCVNDSSATYGQLRNLFYFATQGCATARDCYERHSYTRFWETIENTEQALAQYSVDMSAIQDYAKQHLSLCTDYLQEYRLVGPSFPVTPDDVAGIGDASIICNELDDLRERASQDATLAQIYEQRRTTNAVQNIGMDIAALGKQIQVGQSATIAAIRDSTNSLQGSIRQSTTGLQGTIRDEASKTRGTIAAAGAATMAVTMAEGQKTRQAVTNASDRAEAASDRATAATNRVANEVRNLRHWPRRQPASLRSSTSFNRLGIASKLACSRLNRLCAREELNLHALIGHWHLKPARLPFRHSRVFAQPHEITTAGTMPQKSPGHQP